MKRNFKREKWLQQFEAAVTQTDIRFAGRIDWDTAIHLFNQGNSPGLAAVKFLDGAEPKPIAPKFPSGAIVRR